MDRKQSSNSNSISFFERLVQKSLNKAAKVALEQEKYDDVDFFLRRGAKIALVEHLLARRDNEEGIKYFRDRYLPYIFEQLGIDDKSE